MYILIGAAAATDLKRRLPNYVLLADQASGHTYTIVGNVINPGYLALSVSDKLVIPRGSSLTILGNLLLSSDTVVIIDGKIRVEGNVRNYKIADVSGANQRQLWLQTFPDWLQWILLYIFFGWIWIA